MPCRHSNDRVPFNPFLFINPSTDGALSAPSGLSGGLCSDRNLLLVKTAGYGLGPYREAHLKWARGGNIRNPHKPPQITSNWRP